MMILDDHPLVRQGIGMIVSASGKIEITGEASASGEALRLLQQTSTDIVLVDLNLRHENGLDFIQQARMTSSGANCKYMILTSSATQEEMHRMKALQVDGICLKEALPEDLIYAIETVVRGRKYIDPELMDSLMEAPAATEGKQELADLTPKEYEVLTALGRGLSNKDIASELYITEFTVKKHVSQILSKLSLADRTQAALYALANGLVQYELARA